MNSHELNYAIMNGYHEYPQNIGTDIDVCVENLLVFDKLLSILSIKLNFKLVQKLEHHYQCINYFIAKQFGEEWVLLSLDIYVNYVYKNNILFESAWFLNGRRRIKNFYVADSKNEFIYYMVKKIIKQDVSNHIHSLLNEFSSIQGALDFSPFFPRAHREIVNAFESNDHDYFIKNVQKLNDDLDSVLKINPFLYFMGIIRVFKRAINPSGLKISFLGPDGSGKSTIIDALEKVDIPFRRVDYFHLKPRIIGQKGDGKPVPNPHEKSLYPGLLSYIKWLHFALDYWLGLPKVRLLKTKSSLVIFDRYYDDFYVDPRRFRYGGKVSFARNMKKVVPQMELTFILISDPDVIYSRKKEVRFDELTRQIGVYRGLEGGSYILIDVNKDVDVIINEILGHLYGKLNERY